MFGNQVHSQIETMIDTLVRKKILRDVKILRNALYLLGVKRVGILPLLYGLKRISVICEHVRHVTCFMDDSPKTPDFRSDDI